VACTPRPEGGVSPKWGEKRGIPPSLGVSAESGATRKIGVKPRKLHTQELHRQRPPPTSPPPKPRMPESHPTSQPSTPPCWPLSPQCRPTRTQQAGGKLNLPLVAEGWLDRQSRRHKPGPRTIYCKLAASPDQAIEVSIPGKALPLSSEPAGSLHPWAMPAPRCLRPAPAPCAMLTPAAASSTARLTPTASKCLHQQFAGPRRQGTGGSARLPTGGWQEACALHWARAACASAASMPRGPRGGILSGAPHGRPARSPADPPPAPRQPGWNRPAATPEPQELLRLRLGRPRPQTSANAGKDGLCGSVGREPRRSPGPEGPGGPEAALRVVPSWRLELGAEFGELFSPHRRAAERLTARIRAGVGSSRARPIASQRRDRVCRDVDQLVVQQR